MSNERIQEYVSLAGQTSANVNQGTGVIRGVRVLGPVSKNRRRYAADAITEAVGLYESAPVFIDHPRNPTAPRSYADLVGRLRAPRVKDAGITADLHLNVGHPMAAAILTDAAAGGEGLGLSHNIQARTSRRGSETLVEEITRVHSVDIVVNPATTTTLFEGKDPDAAKEATAARIAEEIGLPAIAVPDVDGGLRWCEGENQIRVYLEQHKAFLQRKGLLPTTAPKPNGLDLGRLPGGTPADFANRWSGRLSEADKKRFPSLAGSNCNGHAANWTL